MQLAILILFCSAVLVVLVRMVLRYDRFDREPVALVIFAPAVGLALGWLCVHPQVWIETPLRAFLCRYCPETTAVGFSTGAAAVLSESAAKLLGVICCMIAARRAFNDPMDGLIYGSLVGAGFGGGEALARHSEFTGHAPLALAAIAMVMHLFFGGILGTAFGLRFAHLPEIRRRWVGVLFSLTLLTMILHFWWDMLAEQRIPGPSEPTRRKLAAVNTAATALLYFGLVPFGSLMSMRRFPDAASGEPIGAALLRWLRFLPPSAPPRRPSAQEARQTPPLTADAPAVGPRPAAALHQKRSDD